MLYRLKAGARPSAAGGPAGKAVSLPLRQPFGAYLVERGLIKQGQWEEALAEAGGQVAEAVRALGKGGGLEPQRLLLEMSRYSGLDALDPALLTRPVQDLPQIPFEYLRHHRLLPIRQIDGRLEVAVADPFGLEHLEALVALTGLEVRPFLCSEESILRRLEAQHGLGRGGLGALDQGEDEAGRPADDTLGDLSSDAPAIRAFNYLVQEAVEQGASDIHLEPQQERVRVRFRIDGKLVDQQSLSPGMRQPLTRRIKVLANMVTTETRRTQDGKIGMRLAGRELDLRVSTVPAIHGESVVVRILYSDTLVASLDGLGMPPDIAGQVAGLIDRPHGLILVTGPTGSGKTTTLYAALEQINRPELKIITIEDPVEYRLPGVSQIQVNPEMNLTFAKGLRSIVRQDPDVILVGEIRDRETADIAIHAALTGHLVFSTLHTNDAAGAVTRLQDMGVDSFLISSSLTAVLAQRLVRRLCPHCRRETVFQTAPGLEDVEPGATIWAAGGCERCQGLGYRGRTGIFELIMVTDRLRALINQKVDSATLRDQALAQGTRTLRRDGWRKVRDGHTSLEEVLSVTS